MDLEKKKVKTKHNQFFGVQEDVIIKMNERTMILFISSSLGIVNVDIDPTIGVLYPDSVQERVGPFRRAVVTNDPSKVYLPVARIVKCLSSEPIRNARRTIESRADFESLNLFTRY